MSMLNPFIQKKEKLCSCGAIFISSSRNRPHCDPCRAAKDKATREAYNNYRRELRARKKPQRL